MTIIVRYATLSALAAALLCSSAQVGDAQQEEVLLGSRGGVEVWSIVEPSPGFGFLATTIELRSAPGTKIVTFEGPMFTGDVHQTWEGQFGAPTPYVDDVQPSASYAADWAAFDSHFLLDENALQFFAWVDESNDGTSTINPVLSELDAVPPRTGWGDLGVDRSTDAAFLHDPADHTNQVPFARVVGCEVQMSLSVFGEGIIDGSEPNGAAFGHYGQPPLQVLNAPCRVPEPSGIVGVGVIGVLLLNRRMVPVATRNAG